MESLIEALGRLYLLQTYFPAALAESVPYHLQNINGSNKAVRSEPSSLFIKNSNLLIISSATNNAFFRISCNSITHPSQISFQVVLSSTDYSANYGPIQISFFFESIINSVVRLPRWSRGIFESASSSKFGKVTCERSYLYNVGMDFNERIAEHLRRFS